MTEFRENPQFRRRLRESAEVRRILLDKAQQAQQAFVAAAPVRDGTWRDSTTAEVVTNDQGYVVGRLRSDDPAALSKEFGTSDTPKHATLRKALDSL